MFNKLMDLITDRNGKVSPYKLAWQLSCYSMLFTVIYHSIKTGNLVGFPENWVPFLVTVGGASITRSYLANKKEETNSAPKV